MQAKRSAARSEPQANGVTTAEDGPKPEPRFRHTDDEKWHEVRAIQVGERRASVWEKWLDFTPGFLSLYAKWAPA